MSKNPSTRRQTVLMMARALFYDENTLQEWLNAPRVSLGSQSFMAMADTEMGYEEAKKDLFALASSQGEPDRGAAW